MNALFKTLVAVFTTLLLAACGGMPTKVSTTAPPSAAKPTEEKCVSPTRRNVYGQEDREFREPPTVWGLYTCSWMQPVIEWAKSASTYEAERGGCTGSHTSFSCTSYRGPQGGGRRSVEWRAEGGRLELALAKRTVRDCKDAPAERRELHVSVDSYGEWTFHARQSCFW